MSKSNTIMNTSKKQVLASIIKNLKEGMRPWQSPYFIQNGRPLKANGQGFNGFNSVILMLAGQSAGFESPYWLTFAQGKKEGGRVKKGSKGIKVFRPRIIEDEEETDENGNPKQRFAGWVAYTVFNAYQFSGLPNIFFPKAKDFGTQKANEKAARFFQHLPAEVVTDSSMDPHLKLASGVISMPNIGQFKSEDRYWATLGHEYIHWTGMEPRLNRDQSGKKGSKRYAFEELVAEMGAAFLMPTLGIKPLVDDGHAPYIAGYLSLLIDEPESFFKAATLAAQACDYLVNLAAVSEQEAREQAA